MTAACDVIGNKDIEHMGAEIVNAITKPKEVPEIMHKMAGVTFVQSVECPALAMIVPLLLRGLKERNTATKRQSAVIIDNVSKLVDNPVDAGPFIPLLLPALESNFDGISDPEARIITERAVNQLKRLKALCEKTTNIRGDTSKIVAELKKALPVKEISAPLTVAVEHAAIVATTMMDLRFMEDTQWSKNVARYFKLMVKDADAATAVEAVRVIAETMMEIPDEDDDDDDAEEVSNECRWSNECRLYFILHFTF